MAKRPKGIEGVGAQITAPSYDVAKYYEVTLKGIVEYPPGSRRFLSPGGYIELRGRVANAIVDHISSAREVPAPYINAPPAPPPRTNLMSVKGRDAKH